MPYEIAELIAILLQAFMIGVFILLFPLARRLGRVMEEWVQIRREASPDRDLLSRIEASLAALRAEVESLDARVDLIGERQEFLESLADSRARERLPGPGPEQRPPAG